MNAIPLVFDIKRTSTVDGPGIRTAVFLKGCNLNCFWCHNPEGKKAFLQSAFFEEKCIGCGTCNSSQNIYESCPAGARKLYGKEYTVDDLFEVITADRDYYLATGGGVTFSGGECMLYPDFVASVAAKCCEYGISVAVDTAGNVPFSSFEKVIPFTDVFLYDIKAVDSKLHVKGTGCDNKLILQNLDKLLKLGKQIIIRVPVIPDFNDDEELEKIKAYCAERNLIPQLLPYHNIGESKSKALG